MTDTGPLFVSSGDLIADRRYKWALDQAARGDFAAAAEILEQTVALAPVFATAWFALGAIRDRLGDVSGAVAAFEKARDADPDDYHGARLQLARLGSGEVNPAMSDAYVRRLFDQYAARYDAALTEHLAYCGPALLREAVDRAMRAAERPPRFGSMLDLGCGTGLAGPRLRAECNRLVGVDLSPRMLAKAAERGCYDALVEADIPAYLTETSERFDLVFAADALVYFGELGGFFAAAARVATPGGIFAFNVETTSRAAWILLPSGRFAHSVEAVLASAAPWFRLLSSQSAFLRVEANERVQGELVVLERRQQRIGRIG